jgi:hypothetical protein
MCRRILVLALFAVLLNFTSYAASNDYSRLARISYLDGNVSFMHPNEVDWAAASVNTPLQIADRVYTGEDGRAEIEFDDGSVIRLAERTDIEVLSLRENLIQVRVLTGLVSLDLRGGVTFEIDTPAAAFTALQKGAYRFDVAENGDTDGIVRKGLLEATNDRLSRQIESEQVIHVVASDPATYRVSKYQARDSWDEWTDRRNADRSIRASGAYLPADVTMGASDLDRYGHWVTVDQYGPAWIPSYVDVAWSPYWSGRWCYRPIWGWTWVSYEPWGWLPYHYGRWYHHNSYGWCWLPGASVGFHFWSPGLVRFYHGQNWVSWAPLGPGDYYNVNQYHYNNIYAHQLNELRMMQNRSPESLSNQNVPGAFRTVRTDNFVQNSFGPTSRTGGLSDIDQPWIRGRMVSDRLNLEPKARSYAPAPERNASRPVYNGDRMPVVVRSQPAVQDSGTRFIRANPPVGASNQNQNESIPAYSGRRYPEVTNPGRNTSGTGRVQTAPVEGERNPVKAPANRVERPAAALPEITSPGMTVGRGRDIPSMRSPAQGTAIQPGVQPARRPEIPAAPPMRRTEPAPPVNRQPQGPAAAPRQESRPVQSRPKPSDPPESLTFTESAGGGSAPRSEWVRTTSRYEATPSQPASSRYQAQEQPGYTRGYAGQEQPSYGGNQSMRPGGETSSMGRTSPQRITIPDAPPSGRSPQVWGGDNSPGRQVSSPAPYSGSYGSNSFPGTAGRIGSAPSQTPSRTYSAPSGGGIGFGGGGRTSGNAGASGGAANGGRRR